MAAMRAIFVSFSFCFIGTLVIPVKSKDVTTLTDTKIEDSKGDSYEAALNQDEISNVDPVSVDDSVDGDIEEVDLYGPPFDKKWVGDIFGGGFRSYKRIGSVLGRGFALGKRQESHNTLKDSLKDIPEKTYEYDLRPKKESTRNTENALDENYANIEDKLLDSVEKEKRLFGHRLGNGFALRKRDKRSVNGVDIDKYVNVQPDFKEFADQMDDWDAKRYFASDMGSRFGRRAYDSDITAPVGDSRDFGTPELRDYQNKRYFDSDFGYRFALGKRSGWKRYFGHVLGNGFRLGKREGEGDDLTDEMIRNLKNEYDKERGTPDGPFQDSYEDKDELILMAPIEVIPNRYDLSDESYNLEKPQIDKRFGYVLGRGFRFGKRPAKRYGWVLGSGYMYGKRSPVGDEHNLDDSVSKMLKTVDENEDIRKRLGPHNYYERNIKRLGHLLGHGFSLGKREDGADTSYLDIPYKREYYYTHFKRRPFGHVLGNGFAFGKRTLDDKYTSFEADSDNEETLDAEKRAFGHWLGHGFKLGKRSKEYPDDEYKMQDH